MITHNNKKIVLLKVFLLMVICISLQSFIIKPAEKSFTANTVSVKVVQEKNDLTVSVISPADNKIQFYMFSIDGKLIKELKIHGSKKISITQLEKGTYTYDFFSNDERLKSGNIELK